MRNENDRFVGGIFKDGAVKLVFGDGIECRRRLIHDDKLVIAGKNTRNGDLLPFSAGKVRSLFVEFARQRRIDTLFKRCELFGKSRLVKRRDNGLTVMLGVIIAVHHVFGDACGVYLEILEHDADLFAVCVKIIFAYVPAVHEDLPRGRVVKTHEQLDERRLARAVVADDGDLFAARERQRYIFKRLGGRMLALGLFPVGVMPLVLGFVRKIVCEGHVAQLKRRKFRHLRLARCDPRLVCEKAVVFFKEKRMLREFCRLFNKIYHLPTEGPYNADARGKRTDEHKTALQFAEHIEKHTELQPGGNEHPPDTVEQKPLHAVLFRELYRFFGILVVITHEQIGHSARPYFLGVILKLKNTVYVVSHSVQRLPVLFLLKTPTISHLVYQNAQHRRRQNGYRHRNVYRKHYCDER